MNKTAVGIIGFAVGAGAGFAGAYFYLRKKYEDKANREIELMRSIINKEEVREEATENPTELTSSSQENIATDIPEDVTEILEDPMDVLEDGEFLKDEDGEDITTWGYDADGNKYPPPDKDKAPYLIPVREAGERVYFDTDEYQYYDDGVITDCFDDLVEAPDREGYFGSIDIAGSFGYDPEQPDVVAIRNERLQLDFVIARQVGTWLEHKGVTNSDFE